jgi:sporulation protein YlmC with PRC-barrel domain
MKKIAITTACFAAILLFCGSPLFAGDKQAEMMHSSFRSSDLVGKTVENHNGEKLGAVEDLVIGPDGQITYVVISHGEDLKMGDKLTPVPFAEIERDPTGEGKIIIDVEKQEMKNASGFARNQWPDFSDASYQENLHGYFDTADRNKAEDDNLNIRDDEKLKRYRENLLRTAPIGAFAIP